MSGNEKTEKMPPVPVVQAVDWLRERVRRLHRRMVPAPVAMLELIMASMISQAIQVAAHLRIADALADGPRTPDEIARQVGASADGVRRLLRALASEGVFRADRSGRYELTPLASVLRSDAEVPMRSIAMFTGSPDHREHWSYLLDSVRSGEPTVEKLRGVDVWTYFERHEELAEVFNEAMTGFSSMTLAPVLAAYDFSRFRKIVDVGGGQGSQLASILGRTPQATGILFDQPTVVANADEIMRTAGVRERCTIESGSFLESVPAGGDAYILKAVIHNWSDDKAVKILRNVRKAIKPHGRLLLIELVLPQNNNPHPSKLSDLDMLLIVGGRERTEEEYAALFARAGFRLDRVVQTASPLAVLEASPV